MKADYIIVGSGFAGATIARMLAEAEKKVLIIEKRNHIAGNMYDELNENGILIQKYGPHIFHTNDEEVAQFVKKYHKWNPFNLKCSVYMENKFTPSPFNFKTIDDYYSINKASEIKEALLTEYGTKKLVTIVEMLNSKNEIISEYAKFLYQKDYSLYTAKQWGISPNDVDINVLKRVPVLLSYEEGYFSDKYQMMPEGGFTAFFHKLIDHENIQVELQTDFKNLFKIINNRIIYNGCIINIPIIYTGALDNLFDYKYEVLPYRTLNFKYETFLMDSYQDAPVVAYPEVSDYTRITEFKKMSLQIKENITTIAKEYPSQYVVNKLVKSEPYYPIVNEENKKQYMLYKNEANKINNLYLCGRLAEYQYFNMDQVIKNAIQLGKELLRGN